MVQSEKQIISYLDDALEPEQQALGAGKDLADDGRVAGVGLLQPLQRAGHAGLGQREGDSDLLPDLQQALEAFVAGGAGCLVHGVAGPPGRLRHGQHLRLARVAAGDVVAVHVCNTIT